MVTATARLQTGDRQRVEMLKQLPPPETAWLFIELLFDSWLEATDMPDVVQETRRLYHGLIQARRFADDPKAIARMFIEATNWTKDSLGRET